MNEEDFLIEVSFELRGHDWYELLKSPNWKTVEKFLDQKKSDAVISRKSAQRKLTNVYAVIKPTNTYNTCLLILCKEGKEIKSAGMWNPTAADLSADDWIVLRDEF